MDTARKEQQLLHSVKGVAAALDCSRSKAYELIASGELESFRLGGLRRVSHSALVAYVEALRGCADDSRATG